MADRGRVRRVGSTIGGALIAHLPGLPEKTGHVRDQFDRFVLLNIYVISIATGLVYTLTYSARAFGLRGLSLDARSFERVDLERGRPGLGVTTVALAALFCSRSHAGGTRPRLSTT
ncbi:MAG: hypothetical protein U0V56_06395 [Actinomycetota bacterium]